jgi:hypothetical protein
MDIVAEIIGCIAVAISVLIYQQKTEKNLLWYKGIADSLWVIHYIIIGGYTGAAISGVSVIRGIVLSLNAYRGFKSKRIWLLFMLVSLVCTAITWQSVFSIFPAVASLLAVISFWIGNPKILRIMSFPISACMMTYGIYNGSVAVIISESLVMISSGFGLLTKDRKRQT